MGHVHLVASMSPSHFPRETFSVPNELPKRVPLCRNTVSISKSLFSKVSHFETKTFRFHW